MKQVPYPAPSFSLIDEKGTVHSLGDYIGQWLVLYFYPADDTPGCTTEACSLRDARDKIVSMGAQIVGISKDNANSHERFKAKHLLNFTLLSDPEKIVLQSYGAWGKKQFGVEGALRKTFIINPDGMVVKEYGRVTPQGHGEQIIADLEKLQTES